MLRPLIYCTLLVAACCLSELSHAQEKKVRIGVSVGVPNIAGFHGEYVTPLLNNRFAPMVQASFLSATFSDVEVKVSYIELGGNYYFFKEGKGLYGNISYGRLSTEVTFSDLDSETTSRTGGTGSADLTMSRFNFKLGAKLGNGFYFRPEIGYALTYIPETVEIRATFPDNSTEIQQEELPTAVGIGLIFTLGFGIAF
ncbi:hypothetical protein QQ008_24625 [Fulvivirgaceae bacterium BMA10]|uniref:Outer membrane protein beta-barrel domain-containing protein n=1 Tax=Splendidivirga corallicola TaxID=3051826 RepID=A0ABT8KYW3_9BACT|nr:hypothetical protein [Fulvivirgaceae bacterium BMA10]